MLVQTVPPAIEPVSPDDIYLRSRIIELPDGGALEGSLILLLISAARAFAESYTGRSFITQQWQLVMDGFPRFDGDYGTGGYGIGQAMFLDRGVVQSVDSISYLAMDGTQQLMPTQNYIADLSGCPARITPVFGQIWPINKPQIASVQVNYTAGYGPAPENVPAGIRDWIAMRVGTIYENREEVAVLNRGKVELLPYIDTLLDPYVVRLA